MQHTLRTPLLSAEAADDGHGGLAAVAGEKSGASNNTPALSDESVDSVEPKPEEPDAAADPGRDDSAVADAGADRSQNAEDSEGAAGRDVPVSGGAEEAESEEEKERCHSVMAGEKSGDLEGAAERGVSGTAGGQSQSGGDKEAEQEQEPTDAPGYRRDFFLPGSAAGESGRSIESYYSESIDSAAGESARSIKDLETDLAGASTTAARIQIIRDQSRRFAQLAAATSMASEAVAFLKALEEFDSAEEGKKKIMETDLNKTGILLWTAADRAAPSEAHLAQVALKLTAHSHNVLLSLSSAEEETSRCCLFLRGLLLRFLGPELTLPLHRVRERQVRVFCNAFLISSPKKLRRSFADKRQALFGVALAAPLALLTSAASIATFPSDLAHWIARISVVLWIGVSCGLVMDLFGNTKLQFGLASCLSRLGMMGVTVLVCLFIVGAFFPSATVEMWFLMATGVGLHALLCILSRRRGDDGHDQDSSKGSTKCRGCTCKCCDAV